MAKQVALADPVHVQLRLMCRTLEDEQDRMVTMSEAVAQAIAAWQALRAQEKRAAQ